MIVRISGAAAGTGELVSRREEFLRKGIVFWPVKISYPTVKEMR